MCFFVAQFFGLEMRNDQGEKSDQVGVFFSTKNDGHLPSTIYNCKEQLPRTLTSSSSSSSSSSNSSVAALAAFAATSSREPERPRKRSKKY
jgi:hypothetical protein